MQVFPALKIKAEHSWETCTSYELSALPVHCYLILLGMFLREVIPQVLLASQQFQRIFHSYSKL